MIDTEDIEFDLERCNLVCENGYLSYVVKPGLLEKEVSRTILSPLEFKGTLKVLLGKDCSRVVIQEFRKGVVPVVSRLYVRSKENGKFTLEDTQNHLIKPLG